MDKFSRGIVKSRFVIFIVSLVLLVPSFFGYISTRVNYDVLSYLPKDIETMVGQDVLTEDFGTGAFTMIVTEGLPYKDVSKLKEKVEDVDHVKKVYLHSDRASSTGAAGCICKRRCDSDDRHV